MLQIRTSVYDKQMWLCFYGCRAKVQSVLALYLHALYLHYTCIIRANFYPQTSAAGSRVHSSVSLLLYTVASQDDVASVSLRQYEFYSTDFLRSQEMHRPMHAMPVEYCMGKTFDTISKNSRMDSSQMSMKVFSLSWGS
jgi:hypothetical protein